MEQPEDPAQSPPPSPGPTSPPPGPTTPGAPAVPDSANAPDAPDTANAPDGTDAPSDLAAVRELILLAYRDVVPELVQGGTIAELRAAVAPARAAYRQVAERITGAPAGAPPAVPAGAAGGVPPIDGLPPGELIKRALQRRG